MQNYNIIMYQKNNGEKPVERFLHGLNVKTKARAMRMIKILKDNGTRLREPYSKSLGDGIFELRIQQGNDRARILYFFMHGNNIVLTNGFVKKTQKTPNKELEKAKRYRKIFLEKGVNYER